MTLIVLEATARVSLILTAALVVVAMLQRQSAAVRHRVLAVALVGAAVVPLGGLVLPAWHPASLWTGNATTTAGAAAGPEVAADTAFSMPTREAQSANAGEVAAGWRGWPVVVVAIWATGAAIAAVVLVVGLARLRRLSSRARPLDAPLWITEASRLSPVYGIRRPVRLLQHEGAPGVMAWGLRRPRVLVPAGAERWSEDRVRVVLAHELAHIARHDWAFQLLAEALRVVWWFNPLTWVVAGRLRENSELASDDAVLSVGVDSCSYASLLLGLARESSHASHALPTTAMAVPSGLERRILAMLNTSLDRRRPSGAMKVLTGVAALCVTVAVATAQSSTATLSGIVVDESGARVPGVEMTLADAGGDVVAVASSGILGDYEFTDVAPGTYSITTRLPGFKKVVRTGIEVGGDLTSETNFTLEVGGLVESMEIRGPGIGTESFADDVVRRECRSAASPPQEAPGAVRVGGSIDPPRKIRHVVPAYPADLVARGIEGLVIMEATISTDGQMEDVRVLRSLDQELDALAAEAVGQWEFTPTLLNCEPVPVIATVSIQFAGG